MKTNRLHRTIATMLFIFMVSGLTAFADGISVTGTVTSEKDHTPLAGVTVVIKNTKKGATTDQKGRYTISTSKGDKLVFSFIGYNTKEITVTTHTHNVELQEAPAALKETMVTNCYAVDYGSYGAAEPRTRSHYMFQKETKEEYGKFTPNQFKTAADEPLSTFSIDVDAASYANMRRFINGGTLPPENAIRSEELINYFPYDYPQPQGKNPVSVTAEVSACPWNTAHRLVHIGLKAKDIETDKLPASNLVFLIDVSGSMGTPAKLPLVQASLKILTKQLRDNDRVAIVTYAGTTAELLPSTSGKDKARITDAVNSLQANGSTAGGAGLQLAYSIARQNFIKGGNNRIILATDGDFNVGLSSDEEMESLIEKERKSGVFLTVLGYGMGNYKDSKMQVIAQKGNGNHAYIDNLSEARKVLINEFGSTLFTVAKDVKLQIEFNPGKVNAYRLIGYESRLLNKEDFNDDTKDAGEMGAGHTVTALYEVIPVGAKGLVDELKYKKNNKTEALTGSPELLTVKLRYKEPEGDASKKIEHPVTDKNLPLDKTSDNFRFSAAVAGFGMLLNHSGYSNGMTYEQVIALARKAAGEDPEGYRKEFIRLAENAALLNE